MRAFDGNKKLDELTLPASHRSSARALTERGSVRFGPEPLDRDEGLEEQLQVWYTCQEMTVAEQLQHGVRMVDLRCGLDFRLSSGPVELSEHIDSPLEACVNFVTQNPSEVVLVLVQWSSDYFDTTSGDLVAMPASQPTNFARDIRHQLVQSEKWYTGSSWPKLDAVRGKCVLLRTFASQDESFGIDVGSNVARLDRPFDYLDGRLITITARWEGCARRREAIRDLHNDFRCQIGRVSSQRWIFSDFIERETNMAVVKLNMARP